MAGVDIVHVPHKGSDQARIAVLGGQVADDVRRVPHHGGERKGGKVKALGTTGKSRSRVTPELPTPPRRACAGYETDLWLGLMAPRATPRPCSRRSTLKSTRSSTRPEVKENWAKQGAVTMGMSIEQFDKFLREDIQKWSKLVKSTGMKID